MKDIKLLEVGESLPINQKLAGLVPMATDDEQVILNNDIKENGLREPVVLWRGEIVDGRCRQKACLTTNTRIMAKELDDELSEEEVAVFVKSVNTRRNLTQTQKIMVACKESLKPGSRTLSKLASDWGISVPTLKNARAVAKSCPHFIKPLFDGKSIEIEDEDGNSFKTNKITTIYSYVRRLKEKSIKEDTAHAWDDNSYIKTQKGKEWYYKQVRENSIKDVRTKMLIAELANYKF